MSENGLILHSFPPPEGISYLYDLPNMLTQKFPAPSFKIHTTVDLEQLQEEDEVGLTVLGYHYAGLSIKRKEQQVEVRSIQGKNQEGVQEENSQFIVTLPLDRMVVEVEVTEDAHCTFKVHEKDGIQYIGPSFQATQGHWTGAQVGIYCTNRVHKKGKGGYAVFRSFIVSEVE